MHLDLIDHLRCPRAHEETALVASVDRIRGRDIEDGSLGCPVCLAHYPIRGFVADFTRGPTGAWRAHGTALARDDAAVTRLAAMLDARTPGRWYLLFGDWGTLAASLAVSFDARCVLVNPPAGAPLADGASIILVPNRLPFAREWAAGAALDAAAAEQAPCVIDAVRAVQSGGRLVAPAAAPLPSGVKELAHDASWWVGEREASAGPPVPLRRISR